MHRVLVSFLLILFLFIVVSIYTHFKKKDIKNRLMFNWYNYNLFSLLKFCFLYLANFSIDLKLFHNMYKIKYIEQIKKYVCPPSDAIIKSYIKYYCCNIYADRAGVYVYSMLTKSQLKNVEYCCTQAITNNIPGDFLEAGVWRGGTGILMQDIIRRNKGSRKIYLLDSYEGMENLTGKKEAHPLDKICSDILNDTAAYFKRPITQTSINEVTNNLKKFNYDDGNITLMKGWFNEKFPFETIGTLSVLRLDCDYYYPTKICLEKLYPKLSNGGYIILDEYFVNLLGEKDAVDEYRKQHNIINEIIPIDENAAYWVKC